MEHLAEVEREHAGDRGNHRRLDDPEVGPAEHEPARVAERLADEYVESAGPGMRDRQLRQHQRAADREHPAHHPGEQDDPEARKVLRHRVGRAEDPGADDVGDRDSGRGVGADLAPTLEPGTDRDGVGSGQAKPPFARAYSDATLFSSSSMMRSGFTPSASAVKLVTMRCLSTAGATARTSSTPGA